MLRLILLMILGLLVLTGIIAVALYHFLGLTGLVVFPFVMLVVLWILMKVIGKFVKRLLTIPFKMKAGVLHKAGMQIHSITPVTVVKRIKEGEIGEAGELKHYYDVDVTITPQGNAAGRVWEPGEFILTSKPVSKLGDLEAGIGSVHETRIWNGTEFAEDDPGKYPGPQRVKLTFEVKPDTTKAWLQYYIETIGVIDLPAWKPEG
jgi:hypothetical protein